MITRAIFYPKRNSMIRDYPELKEYNEFSDLSDLDLRFVWYLACQSSEAIDFAENKKRDYAYKMSYGETMDTKHTMYLSGDYPQSIRVAIERMKSFNPSARMRGKMMLNKIFDDFQEVVNMSVDNQTFDDLKKYTDLKIDIVKALPDLIKKLEQGFGVTEIEEIKSSDKRMPSYFDTVQEHMSKNNVH